MGVTAAGVHRARSPCVPCVLCPSPAPFTVEETELFSFCEINYTSKWNWTGERLPFCNFGLQTSRCEQQQGVPCRHLRTPACSRIPTPTSAHVQEVRPRGRAQGPMCLRRRHRPPHTPCVKVHVLPGIPEAHHWTPGVHRHHAKGSWIKSFAQGCSSSTQLSRDC